METPVSPITPAPAEPTVNPKRLLPKADLGIFELATVVGQQWATTPALTLLWLPLATYQTTLADFGANLTEKRRVAAERSPNVQRLLELDDVADNALPFVKGYIIEEAGSKEKGKAQYAAHGMVLVGQKSKNMEWSADRQERVKSVEMLLVKLGTGATALPYAGRKFGTAFWQTWLQEYQPLVEGSGDDAGTISHKVGRKDAARQTISKALQAIIYLLKANYPDTFAAELRAWGFRKEGY